MKQESRINWTADRLLEMGRSYQAAAVLGAAADLDVFPLLAMGPLAATDAAQRLQCDARGLTLLLDALAALGLLSKHAGTYALPANLLPLLTPQGSRTVLAMCQHQANCLRRWAQLAQVIKEGHPAECRPSVRGQQGDAESFIGAMHNISAPLAQEVIQAIQPLRFRHLLDVGGASGTWTMAFLRACGDATATLFDLPHVIPMAQVRLAEVGLANRVHLVAGDFMKDPLPQGADLAWISAIAHQNSRAQNRELFANVFQALSPGGRIAVRDLVMEPDHTQPVAGALFAINMLVATPGGSTFTLAEFAEDLQASGFVGVKLARQDQTMNSVVVATKPA